MHQIRVAVRDELLDATARDVPLERIRHDDRPIYVAEGYGGRSIDHFPPFRFYSALHAGRRCEAIDGFAAWYVRQFRTYGAVEKKQGGMRNGTLHRLLLSLGGGSDAGHAAAEADDEDLLRRAARLRAEQRMSLFESIRDLGYWVERTPPIIGAVRGRDVYLTGGHHRAAALRVLGWTCLPRVSVFPSRFLRGLKRLRVV
jgi:hypothetical protein